MRKFLLLILLGTLRNGYAQNTIALPEIINFSKQQYNAGTQNWRIAQDRNGIMYFANNSGLLCFDGSSWRTYPLPNETIVRSVAIGKDEKIYIGSQSEIGYFEPDRNGILSYHSLTSLIPENELDFADVWEVIVVSDQVFFRSHRRIFQLNSGKISVYSSVNWNFMGYGNGMLIANEYNKGLLLFEKGIWKPFLKKGNLPSNARLTSITAINKDSLLITTLKHGMFLLNNQMELKPFNSPACRRIAEENIYASAMLNEENIVIATNMSGCYIINKKGDFIQRLSKQDGLQNNNLLSIYIDRGKNLWIGSDNGIDLAASNSAIKHIYPDNQEHSAGYTTLIHNRHLYMGTARGLFKAPLNHEKDLSLVQGNFTRVPGSKGQVWSLNEVNGELLMGHNEGAFLIYPDRAEIFDSSTGFWNFMPVSAIGPSSKMAAGTYNGINIYNYENGRFRYANTQTYFESARFVGMDNQLAWVAHPYKGLYRVELNNGVKPSNNAYPDTNKILSQNRNYIYKIKSRIVLSSDKGLFEFNAAKGEFEPSAFLHRIFGNMKVQYLKEDDTGNIWFISNKKPGVVEFSGETPEITVIQELSNKVMGGGYECIYPYDAKNIFIGGEEGFFHLNLDRYKQPKGEMPVRISAVKANYKNDSTIFGGYTTQNAAPKLNYNWNSIHFDYVSPLYGQQSGVEYSWYLENFDKQWSPWTKKTEKEYTNLSPGTYTFKVKARRFEGDESEISRYGFTILPPWYGTPWAYTFYILLGMAGIYFIYRWQKRKFIHQRQLHKEEQERLQYLHQLELERSENEIIKLRNEKLEAEIQLKNTELASTTMNLVQKGEMLNKVKEEFVKLKKDDSKENSSDDYKKIIRMLEEQKFKNDWDQFAVHFDKVHSDFLVSLKEQFPKLTPSELKLCAYLRLNLSSKEIAQIMNITIKSVELSRYRLRKKLGIPGEQSIFNFLLDFHSTSESV